MLVIGSRAICYHFPDFRPPRDWDLVGTDEEIARLDRLLPRAWRPRSVHKAHFRLGQVLVEVANASTDEYWGKVLCQFQDEPTIEEPTLGTMHVAPAPYLLLTKHCGLIYRIAHWHKNLEDLYYLRERIPTIPDSIAALLPDALADSRRMFEKPHITHATEPWACHPALLPLAEPDLHTRLHDLLKLGSAPVRDQPTAWDGFPRMPTLERRRLMRLLFAEEAMVLAAEQILRPNLAVPSEDEAELTRWALRSLITSGLPETWRYFGVNHYREIRNLVPAGWTSSIASLPRRSRAFHGCEANETRCDPAPADRIAPVRR